jgi:hypothetical protein
MLTNIDKVAASQAALVAERFGIPTGSERIAQLQQLVRQDVEAEARTVAELGIPAATALASRLRDEGAKLVEVESQALCSTMAVGGGYIRRAEILEDLLANVHQESVS